MASEGAWPVLGTDVTMNPGASLSTFTAVPFPPPTPGAQHRPPWQQHLPRPITPAFPPGSSLLLPAFPRTPLVVNGGHGPSAPGACNLTVQVRSQGRPVEAPQTQTFVVTQAPLNWSAPGALSRSAACPAPEFIATPVMGTVVTAPAVGVSQAGKGGWTPGFPPQAPPPAAQLAPIIRPVNSGPWPHGTSREGRLATNQSNASQDGSSNPQREYSNFRRWQHLKPLARRHFHRSPDAEAFSCFLIPVLRFVARLNPYMPLEEGLWRAVQEWRRLSNLDRMIYYERAEKFMEFAAEEETHIKHLQWMQCAQDLPPPAPPKLDPRGPPAPKVGLQPGTQLPTGAEGTDGPDPAHIHINVPQTMPSPTAQPSHPKPHRSQWPPEPKAPKEIPPETVREYVDRMEALVGHIHSATGKSPAECGKDGNELKQEEDDTYLDPCLLSYTDELRSREHSVTKVEAVIHPRFLAELFSPDPQLDVLALAEELEQEEGLTPEELVQKRLLALKEYKGGPAAPSHSAPGMGSSPSESHTGQGAQRHDQDRHRGVSDEACPPEIDVEALHRPIRTDTGPFVLRVFVPSRGRQAGKGGWTPGFPPQAPPPAAQLAPIIRPVNSGPWPHGTSREGRLATNQSNASQDGSSKPQREYSNFRRWQHIKPLARRHFHLSPDAEAFSCFLIPVLRFVARLNPYMPLEEGLWRAVQEWRRLSNLDRMIYYERAEKFMEFAAEEEMHIQHLQWMQCVQDLPPPAPPKLDPRGPPAPKPHRSQWPPEPKAPKEIPPETVREYVDRMEAMVGHVHSATGKSPAECGKDGNELKQEEDDTYLDPCLLSYTDELRSREHSVTKVEAVIHPRFLAELFSPDPQLDVLALAEELEQEEGLTPEELVQKQLLDLKEEEGGPAAPSHSAPGMGSSPSESHAGQGAQTHDQDRHRGVSDEACPPESDFEALHRPIRADTGPFVLRVFVPCRGRQEVSPFRAGRASPPQGQRRTGPLLGPRDVSVRREASPILEARGPRDASSENEEALPSLASLLASPQSLPPCGLSQTPAPASGLASPGAAAEKLPIPGAGHGVSARPALALGLARPSQPRKRKRDPFVTGKRRKKRKHCSQ
ncbi:NUT family member 2G-like [Balaenoptera ricei]|uniref:NUT family member 2G-like n=1 Tax=Balaenoptera ricei TaxID=2746895 RepID=UPI0028BDF3AD|nr:NUT family member 2G-like [Balaenoptera ricei]